MKRKTEERATEDEKNPAGIIGSAGTVAAKAGCWDSGGDRIFTGSLL